MIGTGSGSQQGPQITRGVPELTMKAADPGRRLRLTQTRDRVIPKEGHYTSILLEFSLPRTLQKPPLMEKKKA